MDNSIVSVTSRVDRFVHQVLFETQLDVDFHSFIIHSYEKHKKNFEINKECIISLFTSFSQEEISIALRRYVFQISLTSNHEKLKELFLLLEHGVKTNCVPPRLVCDALLTSESLVYQNEDFWCSSFEMIKNILSRIDYEAIRDLFNIVLDAAVGFESTFNISVIQQTNAVYNVIETILDRNANIVPSYLLLKEFQKEQCPVSRNSIQSNYHCKIRQMKADFIDSFRPVAQMASVSVFMKLAIEYDTCGHGQLLPLVGYSTTLGNAWQLDASAKFMLEGPLPYNKELLEPQLLLLKYVLKQTYSKEMVSKMLLTQNKEKKRSPALEMALVQVMIAAVDGSDNQMNNIENSHVAQLFWQHIANQLIFFVLFKFVNFTSFIETLHDKLSEQQNNLKGRNFIMWVILECVSGNIQKNQLSDFEPVLKLYDLLYPDKHALPIEDVTKRNSKYLLAPASLWIHLSKKAQMEQVNITKILPNALTGHLEFLENTWNKDKDLLISLNLDYKIPILCNAYSTSQEYFKKTMSTLIDASQGMQKPESLFTGPHIPLSMETLDALTVHVKMSLIFSIATYIAQKLAPLNATNSISPALMETFARLFVYNEIETFGFKSFIDKLLPALFKYQAWDILRMVLDMLSYRLQHFQPVYRIKLLSVFLGFSFPVSQANQTKLYLCVKSAVLKLLVVMKRGDLHSLLSRQKSEIKFISKTSEEFNKILILAIARVIHISGCSVSATWCKNVLSTVMLRTPHIWPSFTSDCFPQVIREFYETCQVSERENVIQLKLSVEEEFKKWKTMNNEKDIFFHFSTQKASLFLCLLWKILLNQNHIPNIAITILNRIGVAALSAHLRKFTDFLVYEFSISSVRQHITDYIDMLNILIWKYHVIQFEQLVLCLVLRSFEGKEAQVCFFVIQMLLLKSDEFKMRLDDFVDWFSPDHLNQADWHEKHLYFHKKYEEKIYSECLQNIDTPSEEHVHLPLYFGNICLRFLPVLDTVIHRFIELPTVNALDNLLDKLGCLYKFHDQPLTYLYETLHYYEQKLQPNPLLKKKLVSTIICSLDGLRPQRWALSEDYLEYIQNIPVWIPDTDYYVKLIVRLIDAIEDKKPFPYLDWRLNEFPNEAAHALHVTCIELMALPTPTPDIANALLDLLLTGRNKTVHSKILAWMNAIGLLLTALPETFRNVFFERIIQTLQSPLLASDVPLFDPFEMFDFAGTYNSMNELFCSFTLALSHSFLYHASHEQICLLPGLLKEKLKPFVANETQFIFICHLVAPFLQRFFPDRASFAEEIITELYVMLDIVDKKCEQWHYFNAISDLLYHIKYTHPDVSINFEIENRIKNLRPALQHKLRFIISQ